MKGLQQGSASLGVFDQHFREVGHERSKGTAVSLQEAKARTWVELEDPGCRR